MDRSVVFVVGVITFLALLVFTKGLIRIVSETHPDNSVVAALDEITD